MIRKILTICFDKWLRPLLFFGIVAITFTLSLYGYNSFQTVLLWLNLISLAGLLGSIIYQLYKKRWTQALVTMIVFSAWTFFLVFIFYTTYLLVSTFFSSSLFMDMPAENSTWKNNLTIPDKIPLNDPISTNSEYPGNDSVKNLSRVNIDLELYNSFQPGLYNYHFWIDKIDSGTIYLKAYEITQEYALSADRLPMQSEINVYNPIDSIVRVSNSHDFTIYEGDWGDPYAARFEVWFKPVNGTPEKKLFEKNYKIEGWQR